MNADVWPRPGTALADTERSIQRRGESAMWDSEPVPIARPLCAQRVGACAWANTLPTACDRRAPRDYHPTPAAFGDPSAIPRRARYLGIDPGRRVSVRHPRGVSVLGDGAEATDFGSCTNTQTSAIALVNILTTAGASASVRRGGDSPDWHRTESNGLPWSAPCLGFLVAGVTLVDNCARGRWSVR